MKDSTRKFIRKNLEKECKEINFINYNSSVYIYPSSLKIEDVVLKIIKQTDEVVKLKDKLATENDPLSSCGKIIREEMSDMKDKLPWPPQPNDLTRDKFEIPANLYTFLTILLCDNKKNIPRRVSRLKYSFAQDLIYAASNGRIKSPKSILLPSIVKALTNNTELISAINKLGHGMSYSLLMEAKTENAYKIYEQQLNNDCIIPKKCKKGTLTMFVADNNDRNEETLSGNLVSKVFKHIRHVILLVEDEKV